MILIFRAHISPLICVWSLLHRRHFPLLNPSAPLKWLLLIYLLHGFLIILNIHKHPPVTVLQFISICSLFSGLHQLHAKSELFCRLFIGFLSVRFLSFSIRIGTSTPASAVGYSPRKFILGQRARTTFSGYS